MLGPALAPLRSTLRRTVHKATSSHMKHGSGQQVLGDYKHVANYTSDVSRPRRTFYMCSVSAKQRSALRLFATSTTKRVDACLAAGRAASASCDCASTRSQLSTTTVELSDLRGAHKTHDDKLHTTVQEEQRRSLEGGVRPTLEENLD